MKTGLSVEQDNVPVSEMAFYDESWLDCLAHHLTVCDEF
jgi:hypothetical protein